MQKAINPDELAAALAVVHSGSGELYLTNLYNHARPLQSKVLKSWDEIGKPLLRPDGTGFRMRVGKSSVFLFPGQLLLVTAD